MTIFASAFSQLARQCPLNALWMISVWSLSVPTVCPELHKEAIEREYCSNWMLWWQIVTGANNFVMTMHYLHWNDIESNWSADVWQMLNFTEHTSTHTNNKKRSLLQDTWCWTSASRIALDPICIPCKHLPAPSRRGNNRQTLTIGQSVVIFPFHKRSEWTLFLNVFSFQGQLGEYLSGDES